MGAVNIILSSASVDAASATTFIGEEAIDTSVCAYTSVSASSIMLWIFQRYMRHAVYDPDH